MGIAEVRRTRSPASSLILVSGGALVLLGNQHQIIDIDFMGDDVNPDQLHKTILRVAKDLKNSAEPVPLDRFVPLPDASDERIIRIGTFGTWRLSLLKLTVLPFLVTAQLLTTVRGRDSPVIAAN